MARLQEQYYKEIRPGLAKAGELKNIHQVPELLKIVISSSLSHRVLDSKRLQQLQNDVTAIAGQKAILTKARKSVSTFKTREGMNLGVKVTLRKKRMYEFLDRFVNIALPRIRDFRGLTKNSFNKGVYNMGLTEHFIFPEVNYDKLEAVSGMNISFVTTAETEEEALALLKAFNMPFTR